MNITNIRYNFPLKFVCVRRFVRLSRFIPCIGTFKLLIQSYDNYYVRYNQLFEKNNYNNYTVAKCLESLTFITTFYYIYITNILTLFYSVFISIHSIVMNQYYKLILPRPETLISVYVVIFKVILLYQLHKV